MILLKEIVAERKGESTCNVLVDAENLEVIVLFKYFGVIMD